MLGRRNVTIGCALFAISLLAWGAWLVEMTNRNESEREEHVLALEAERVSKRVDAWKPQMDNALLRFLNFQRVQIRVLLYDLSGWEIGRPPGTYAALPLNEIAPRLAWPGLLRPLNGETPLPPYPLEHWDELVARSSTRNRLFASNVVGSAWISVMKSRTDEWWLVATTPVADFDKQAARTFVSGWIQAAVALSEIQRPARDRWITLFLAAAGAAAVFAGFLWAFSQQSRSLNATAALAEQIPLDRLAVTRLPEPPDNPAAFRLVHALNRLLEKVADAHVAQQRFVADAAHELRTPLTILRGETQVALREPANHPLLLETLRSNLDEAVHLSRLVNSLLTLARSDAGQALVVCEPVELIPLVQGSLPSLSVVAAERGVRLECEPAPEGPPLVAKGDAVALERVLLSLLDNAVKHSPPNQAVRVAVRASADKVQIDVIDRGIGIAPEHLLHLFERFYRVDASRRRADGGAGLGLAIVKTLVEAQRGTVSVQSEIGVGSTFTVELLRWMAVSS